MGHKEEVDKKISPEEAAFAIPAGLAVTDQLLKEIDKLKPEIKEALNDATILELFNTDKESLSPEQVELLGNAVKGIDQMTGLLEKVFNTVGDVIDIQETVNREDD